MKMPQRTWFPMPHQLIVGPSEQSPYLHSLWVGFTTPVFNAPTLIWRCILAPVLNGTFHVIQFFLASFWAGVRGRAHGFVLDLPKITISVTTDAQDSGK